MTSHVANLITLFRILLVLPIAAAIVAERVPTAFALLAAAVFSDALDGHLARRFGKTTLGSWLDVIADRLLIAAVLAALWWVGAVPLWLVLVLVAREVTVAIGALVAFSPQRPVRPLLIGKLHTACVFVLLIATVAGLGGWLDGRVVDGLGLVVVATAASSLVAYAWLLRA